MAEPWSTVLGNNALLDEAYRDFIRHTGPALSPFNAWVLLNGLTTLDLATDDGRLLQGATTTPPPLACVQDWPVEGACALGYCGWVGDGLETVGEVEEFFARMCFEIDQRLGEPAGCRWFLNWFDETPRDEMRELLLVEVERALELRREAEAEAADFEFDAASETAAA